MSGQAGEPARRACARTMIVFPLNLRMWQDRPTSLAPPSDMNSTASSSASCPFRLVPAGVAATTGTAPPDASVAAARQSRSQPHACKRADRQRCAPSSTPMEGRLKSCCSDAASRSSAIAAIAGRHRTGALIYHPREGGPFANGAAEPSSQRRGRCVRSVSSMPAPAAHDATRCAPAARKACATRTRTLGAGTPRRAGARSGRFVAPKVARVY